MMDEEDRPRKRIEGKATGRRRPKVSSGVPKGKLKGKPLADQGRVGPEKVSLATARRTAVDAERIVSPRRELPLPTERQNAIDPREGRSLRLRLQIEGERIIVLEAAEVAVPTPLPEQVRGTDFLEVRAGGEVVALEPLIDPGVAVGIPDARDTTEFRGHREMTMPSYELTVRVPLDALESVISREIQGSPDEAERRGSIPLEIAVYRATENLVIEPRRFDMRTAARGDRLARVATTGRLRLDEVRRSGGRDRKSEAEQNS
jgi:hypothetical protein